MIVPFAGQKSTAFSIELVEHLHDQVGCAAHEAGIGRRFELDARPRKGIAVTRHGRLEQFLEIEIHAFGLLDAFLDARSRAERAQDGLQPQDALACANDVAALVRAHALGFQIVERGAHDGQGRSQFVREFAAEGAQIQRVFVEARQQALEPARQGADFIGARGFRHVEPDSTVRPEGGIGGGAQAARCAR